MSQLNFAGDACVFSHDLKRLPCHRFARGVCINTPETCKFGHFIPETPGPAPAEQQHTAPSDLDIFARPADFLDPAHARKLMEKAVVATSREANAPEAAEPELPLAIAEFDVPATETAGDAESIPLVSHFSVMDPGQSPFL